jgi:hypothetical protein
LLDKHFDQLSQMSTKYKRMTDIQAEETITTKEWTKVTILIFVQDAQRVVGENLDQPMAYCQPVQDK